MHDTMHRTFENLLDDKYKLRTPYTTTHAPDGHKEVKYDASSKEKFQLKSTTRNRLPGIQIQTV